MRRSLLAACLPLVVRKRLAATVTVRGCGGGGGGDGDAAAGERHIQPICTSSQLATVFIFALPFMLVNQIGLLAVPCVATVGWVRCAHPPITILWSAHPDTAPIPHSLASRRRRPPTLAPLPFPLPCQQADALTLTPCALPSPGVLRVPGDRSHHRGALR